jgi:hypothetical protein
MRTDPSGYRRLDLRAHSLLADVPLHDVWAIELEGGGPGRTVSDVLDLLSPERSGTASAPTRFLFALRRLLGRVLGWDREPAAGRDESYLGRLSEAERAASRVPPGTPQGPFRTLLVTPSEAISEVRNATVHAFSVLALEERPGGYTAWWAIHVRPVGAITRWYMALIDPFRRFIVYPALIRQLREAWARSVAA